MVFHSNPQAGGEITDLLNCHKIQLLGTEKTEAQEAERKKISKTMEIKILPGGKQMFLHQNSETELQLMDLHLFYSGNFSDNLDGKNLVLINSPPYQ